MKRTTWCLITLLCVVTLTGCVHERIVSPGADSATVELSEAAVSVNYSMQEMAEADLAEPFKVKEQSIDPNTYGMGKLASVDWHGPAEPLVKRIATITHYRIKVFGKEPTLPVLVSVSEREKYIGDILRQVSLQAREHLKVLVYPSNKLIELHYLS